MMEVDSRQQMMPPTFNAAAAGQPEAAHPDYAPKETLYVRNIEEKLKKTKLKEVLHAAFSEYGRIVTITALRTDRLRGQAWITFQDVESAKAAKRDMHNKEFFGKKIDVQFARERSDLLSKKLNPTFKPDREARDRKVATLVDAKKAAAENEALAARARAIEMEQATRLLMATGLPPGVAADELKLLFQQHVGLVEVRRVPGRDIAFIEYSSEQQARTAILALNMYKLTAHHRLSLSYATPQE